MYVDFCVLFVLVMRLYFQIFTCYFLDAANLVVRVCQEKVRRTKERT